MAVYRGPEGKDQQKQAKLLPPGYGIDKQRPSQYSLPPLTQEEKNRSAKNGLPRVGVRRNLPAQAFDSATVVLLPDGRRLWRATIVSPEASGLRVHFRRFAAGGGQAWVYVPPTGAEAVQSEGPFTGNGPFGDGDFWTEVASGASVTVEYVEAAPNSAASMPPFEIDSVAHLWDGVLTQCSASDSSGCIFPAAASCHLDVTCYPDYQNMSKGVVQFNFVTDEGSCGACSGSMVTTRNSSFKPYLLTAHHCISSDAEARSIDARFFYQTSTCNGTPPARASVPGISGGRYLAGAPFAQGDYALVLLNANAPPGAWFLGWNAGGLNIGDSALGIHHPAGSWKRISFGNRTDDKTVTVEGETAPATLYYQVSWSQGKTQPGSSGSPLLNSQGQVLGTLTAETPVPQGGSSVCDINPEIATYGRFSDAYPAISGYLEDTPPPSITVTPASMTFTVVNGQYSGPSQQAFTIRTQSVTPLSYSLTPSAQWIKLSNSSGSVSASAPASVTVTLDLSYFPASVSGTGTVTVSSGTLTPISIAVQANVTVTASKVAVTVAPNPVYQQTADSDGYSWFYTVTLRESGGVSTRVTSFKIGSTDYGSNIVSWFGSDQLPATGTLSVRLRSRALTVPVNLLFQAGGVDSGTNRTWTAQFTASFLPRPTSAVLTMDSAPTLIRQNPNSTTCPWYQQLVLQEVGGFSVSLNRFVAAGWDLSAQIASYWGSTQLPASGSLRAGLCWTQIETPASLDIEVDGVDGNGTSVSAKASGSFSGPAANATTMSASPVSVMLNAPGGSSAAVTSSISLNLGSNATSWTGRLVFSNLPNTWLWVWPLSGTGSTTLNVAASPVGLAQGAYQATLVLQAVNAVPQLLNIPVKLSVGASTAPTIAVAPANLAFQYTMGGVSPSGQLIQLTNSGGGVLNWTATSSASWLKVTPASGAAPSTLTVSVVPSGLVAATYSGSIQISSAGASNAPVTVPVTLIVAPAPPSLALSPQTLTFNYTIGASLPVAQSVSVTNTGGGPLSWTASVGANWVGVSPLFGTAPSTLTISVNPAGLQPGAYAGSVQVAAPGVAGSPASVSVSLTVQASPSLPTITGVVNAASFQAGLSSSAWVAVYGTNLATTTRQWRPDEIVGGVLPTQLDGVSATINGKPAALSYISPTQVNVQVPTDTTIGSVQVQITTAQGSGGAAAQMQQFSPGLFTFDGRYAAAQHADYSYVGRPNLIVGVITTPAKPRETVVLYGTGFGPTTPAIPAGQLVTQGAPLANTASAWVGGTKATVEWAGLVGAGLWQLNVTIPADATDGDAVIVAEVGGVQTQGGVYLAIQH